MCVCVHVCLQIHVYLQKYKQFNSGMSIYSLQGYSSCGEIVVHMFPTLGCMILIFSKYKACISLVVILVK